MPVSLRAPEHTVPQSTELSDRDAARLYRLLVHQLPDFAIFMLDPQGIITTWNEGVLRNFGYTEDEFVGKPASMVFTPEDRAAGVPEREMARARQAGSAPDNRWHKHKNGAEIFVNGVLSAVRDPRGKLVGFSKVMRDETSRKRAEQSLELANAALERANRELSNFTYMVSHDLQAPLRAISIYTELLTRNQAASGDERAAYARMIRDGAEQMQTLIRDLLSYAQLGEWTPDGTPVDLESILQQVLEVHAPLIAETGAAVTHDPLPAVSGDEIHLRQLFQNLIGNALKYRGPDPPQIHVSARHAGGEWEISIQDNGQGIPAEYRENIFEPFRRLHSSQIPGTGLGLAICKRIVEKYRGRIWVNPAAPRGSIFRFTLPA